MNTPSTVPSPLQSIGRDLLAGVVVFLVAVPLCLGIAHASGVPIIAGIIAGILGGILVGLLSGSHVSVSGPAAGLTAIVLAQLKILGSFEAFLLALALSGILQMGLGMLRAGVLANYFPNNVIKGLLAAIGVILILKQLPHLVGHDADDEGEMSFIQPDGQSTLSELASSLGDFLPGAAIVGLLCLGMLLAWDRSRLKKSLFPAPLAAVLLGVAINEVMRMAGMSWAIAESHLVSVPVLGTEGQGWNTIFRLPDFAQISNPKVYVAAGTLAIVASLETLLNLEATDKLDPQRRVSPPNRELLAQGVGNLAAGLIGGMPMTSVIVRSSVNANAGARTRLATITHGVLLVVSVFLLPTLLNRIPLSALAAILVVTGFKLANPTLFRQMWKDGWTQFVPFVITVIAIVLTDLLLGVLIGLAVSLLFLLNSSLRRGIVIIRETHASGLVHRIELANQVSFLNRASLMKALQSFQRDDQVVIDARACDYLDPDILGIIRTFRDEAGPARGISVSLNGFRNRYDLTDSIQYVDVTTRDVQANLTPQRALELLRAGNERFVSGHRLHRDLARQVDATSDGQHPMAVVLSCIDSRAPVEMLFDQGIGDIFSCRLAGNVPSRKAMASMEFACKVAGARLVMVLGHTGCGAVKVACDLATADAAKVESLGLTNLPYLLEPLCESVRLEKETVEARSSKNEAFVDRVAALNVHNVMRRVREGSPTLQALLDAGQILMVGGMYDVKTGVVTFFDASPTGGSRHERGTDARHANSH
jgi:carbonic anhydrase/SulP family sulfate permease